MFREPLTWFVVIGAILFTADSLTSPARDEVVVDAAVRDRIAGLWELQMGEPPTPLELENLVGAWVREEVFYREALRLGLDRDDTIVRRRLVQKLGFLAQDMNDEPLSDTELAAWYDANIDDYTSPPRYTFSQVFVRDESRVAEVRQALDAGAEWREVGDSTLLQSTYVAKSEHEIVSALGAEFAGHLDEFETGRWVGPVRSSFGSHLVRLDRVAASEATPLEFIESRVRSDLRQQRTRDALDEYYRELLSQYPVVYR